MTAIYCNNYSYGVSNLRQISSTASHIDTVTYSHRYILTQIYIDTGIHSNCYTLTPLHIDTVTIIPSRRQKLTLLLIDNVIPSFSYILTPLHVGTVTTVLSTLYTRVPNNNDEIPDERGMMDKQGHVYTRRCINWNQFEMATSVSRVIFATTNADVTVRDWLFSVSCFINNAFFHSHNLVGNCTCRSDFRRYITTFLSLFRDARFKPLL